MTNEGLIDKRVDQAIEWANSSQTYIKYIAIAAAQVVGTYSGTTEAIAAQTKRQVSTVQNWAHAFNLYKLLRKDKHMRGLWRKLPISFWWIAWSFQQAGYEADLYLLNADAHGWSTRDMREEYKRDVEAGTAPLQFERVKTTIRGLADELAKRHTLLTPEQIAAVQAVRKAFQ